MFGFNIYRDENILENGIKCNGILTHFSRLIWRRYLKFVPMGDKEPQVQWNQYHGS